MQKTPVRRARVESHAWTPPRARGAPVCMEFRPHQLPPVVIVAARPRRTGTRPPRRAGADPETARRTPVADGGADRNSTPWERFGAGWCRWCRCPYSLPRTRHSSVPLPPMELHHLHQICPELPDFGPNWLEVWLVPMETARGPAEIWCRCDGLKMSGPVCVRDNLDDEPPTGEPADARLRRCDPTRADESGVQLRPG